MPPKRPRGPQLLRHDRALGTRFVVGADEAGRGALAGPLVAAAVVLDPHGLDRAERAALRGLDDSKRLAPAVRDELAGTIGAVATSVAVVAIAAAEIDEIGIQAANLTALARALELAAPPADATLLVDGFALPGLGRPHHRLVKGDATSAAIAAASIIAKVTRDRVLEGLDLLSPGYGFAAHAGYGTAAHREAITRLGPCDAHRRSFAPLAA